jgi:hypothetical protein
VNSGRLGPFAGARSGPGTWIRLGLLKQVAAMHQACAGIEFFVREPETQFFKHAARGMIFRVMAGEQTGSAEFRKG